MKAKNYRCSKNTSITISLMYCLSQHGSEKSQCEQKIRLKDDGMC